jgi:hypothetical protein
VSLAVTHFAVGAALTALVATYLVPGSRYPRLLSGVGGVWAMLPDGHWVSPVATGTLKRLHGTHLMDLFWLHHSLDRLDAGDSKLVAAGALALLLAVTALVERREYRALDRVRTLTGDAVEDPADD